MLKILKYLTLPIILIVLFAFSQCSDCVNWLLGTEDYMTRDHCLMGDNFMLLLGAFADSLVIILYSAVAFVSYIRFRASRDSVASKLWLSMTLVFGLCAICGYGSSIALIYYPVYRIRYILELFILLPATIVLVYTLMSASGKEAFEEMKRGAKYKDLGELTAKINMKVLEENIRKSVRDKTPLSEKDLELVEDIVEKVG